MSGIQPPSAGESLSAEVYQGSQGGVRPWGAATIDRRGPLEFDRNGFPVAQPIPDYVTRLDRLLRPQQAGRVDDRLGTAEIVRGGESE